MTKKGFRMALREMKEAGKEMQGERDGEFCFGEWAGESEREVLEYVCGVDMDDLTSDEVDELLNAYLGY
jgi:hypothetical protein